MSERPVKEKVYLAQLNREVVLNFITLRDDEWMEDRFGKEKLSSAFTSSGLDLDVIFSIFFRILSKEDKELILKLKIYEESDNELKEVKFDDPIAKLRAIISGQKEITDIIVAIVNIRIKSNPAVIEDLKKKALMKDIAETLDGAPLKI